MFRRTLLSLFAACALALPFGLLFTQVEHPTPPQASTVATYARPLQIRLLVLKHSKEYMADGDANLAIQAVQAGAAKGLNIKNIGNHYYLKGVNDNVALNEWTQICDMKDDTARYARFQEWVTEQMKIDQKPHDTLIVFTIGHGGAEGGLHNIGQRADVFKALAAAAEASKQQVIWWQLSCHACARLPALNTLPPSQQRLFSMVASSTADQLSVADLQGRIMNKLFVALADKSNAVDPNGDGIITAAELRAYLNSPGMPRQGGGPIVFGLTDNTPMFGFRGLDLRIIDRIGVQGQYPDDYIPIPD